MINLRCLRFTSCLVCGNDLASARQFADIDQVDDEGRSMSCYYNHPIPRARYRDRIAPELCDWCWKRYQEWMVKVTTSRKRTHYTPPFRQIYLWAWVAAALDEKSRSRLVPHLAEKARVGWKAIERR